MKLQNMCNPSSVGTDFGHTKHQLMKELRVPAAKPRAVSEAPAEDPPSQGANGHVHQILPRAAASFNRDNGKENGNYNIKIRQYRDSVEEKGKS